MDFTTLATYSSTTWSSFSGGTAWFAIPNAAASVPERIFSLEEELLRLPSSEVFRSLIELRPSGHDPRVLGRENHVRGRHERHGALDATAPDLADDRLREVTPAKLALHIVAEPAIVVESALHPGIRQRTTPRARRGQHSLRLRFTPQVVATVEVLPLSGEEGAVHLRFSGLTTTVACRSDRKLLFFLLDAL
jgi:hypothetical protein